MQGWQEMRENRQSQEKRKMEKWEWGTVTLAGTPALPFKSERVEPLRLSRHIFRR